MKILKELPIVSNRLDEVGVAIEQIQEIAFRAIAARNNAVSNHPVNAAGTFSYLEGVKAMRDILITDNSDWEKLVDKNLEFVVNEKTGDRILFQNVDHACLIDHDPQPISKRKGAYKRKVISSNQIELPNFPTSIKSTKTWMICVSENDGEANAEFSLIGEILDDGKYSQPIERVFIVVGQNVEDIDNSQSNQEDGTYDDEFNITEKV